MYTCVYVWMRARVCGCMYIRVHVCMYVSVYVCMYVYVCVCTYVCMYVRSIRSRLTGLRVQALCTHKGHENAVNATMRVKMCVQASDGLLERSCEISDYKSRKSHENLAPQTGPHWNMSTTCLLHAGGTDDDEIYEAVHIKVVLVASSKQICGPCNAETNSVALFQQSK
jgi:hypothetical protein